MTPLLALLIACAPPPLPADSSGGDGLPRIRILFPNPAILQDSDAIVCPMFSVVVDVENFEMSNEHYGKDPVDGEGHWHLYIDDPSLSTPEAAVTAPWANPKAPLSEGLHTLYAAIVQNDHTPLPEDQKGRDVAIVEIDVADQPDCLKVPFGSGNIEDTGA